MSKVYVVCRGSYSDRYVDSVFDDKEKADEYMKIIGTDCDVDEFEINNPELERKSTYLYSIYIEHGTVKYVEINDGSFAKSRVNTIVRDSLFSECYRMYVRAKDSEHARKISSDWFAMFKASRNTNYPYYDVNVVLTRFGFPEYPRYDLVTGEIVLNEGERLVDGVTAKTR